ncbi:Bis(5'-nucleosyl)-tetraphosphatase [Dirofilaria immitis]|nr:Bis(5'-nucleosyl)-tetraphosphatase [Dirofilaria immitis]
MRDSEILNDLKKRMVAVATPLKSRLCLDRGICCIARLIRPARLNSSTFEPQAYRAIASHYRPDDNTCEVLLVDFGQTIVCSTSDLFELHDQPVEVLEKPIASFRCRVKRFSPSKKNGNKGIRLLDENNYNICLTLKCARDLYWAKVTLLGTDFILYCKKPRTFKEKDGKNIKERINIDASSHVKKMPMVDIVRKFEQRKEEIREEERLYEQEKLLRKKKKTLQTKGSYSNETVIRKEQELQLMALQMQLWDISAKLDMVASNNSNFMETACINQNSFSPQLQQNNCSGIPVYTTNDYNHSEVGYSNGSIAASLLQQQQHDIAVNQSWRQQWPSCFLTPQIPKIITPKNKCDGSYQQIISSNSVPSQMSYIPYTYVSNPANDCNFGTSKYNRNISKSPFYLNSKAKKRSVQSKATFPTSKTNSMISNSSTHSMINASDTSKKPIIIVLSGCKISLSADSFWDSCHRKLEYGEPPHRTISDYCNIAKNNRKKFHRMIFTIIFGAFDEFRFAMYQKFARHFRSATKTGTASNVSHKSSIGKLIYTPDESADYNQLCTGTNSYEKQEMAEMIEIDCRKVTIVITDGQDFETLSIYKKEEYHLFVIERLDRFQFVPPEVQISPHLDDEFQTFPTYQVCDTNIVLYYATFTSLDLQIYHKLVSIIDGSELVVQRVGSDVDWPVFFVTLNPASQDITNECFDSLCPTHKLNANEISIGVLCLVQCGNLGRAKVRAIIERFNENIVHVRHIDDGHVEMIQLNELWSIENLSPNVRTQPALAVPCMLASLNEAESIGTISCQRNKIPGVGRLMRILFKEQRKSDGIWIWLALRTLNPATGVQISPGPVAFCANFPFRLSLVMSCKVAGSLKILWAVKISSLIEGLNTLSREEKEQWKKFPTIRELFQSLLEFGICILRLTESVPLCFLPSRFGTCISHHFSLVSTMADIVRAAGMIIYRHKAGRIEYLLLQASYPPHHWTPPKGHVDLGEDEWSAALRETREEAGITADNLDVHKDFVEILKYVVKKVTDTAMKLKNRWKTFEKTVKYWLAKLKDGGEVRLSDEHQNVRWLSVDEASNLAHYKEMGDLIRKAEEYLIHKK